MAMSDEHKAALADGRRQARAIKAYLSALGRRRPGRPVTPDSLKARLESLGSKIEAEPDPLKKVELRQQRIDAEDLLKTIDEQPEFPEMESGFIAHARAYSERKGISYAAWREAGVSAEVLKKAGVPRTRRTR